MHRALTRVLPVVPLKTLHRGVNQYLTRMLGQQLYDGALDRAATPQELASGSTVGLTAEYLTEPGSPGMGDDGVESTTAEVTRTVDAVFEHFGTTRNVHCRYSSQHGARPSYRRIDSI